MQWRLLAFFYKDKSATRITVGTSAQSQMYEIQSLVTFRSFYVCRKELFNIVIDPEVVDYTSSVDFRAFLHYWYGFDLEAVEKGLNVTAESSLMMFAFTPPTFNSPCHA